MSGASGRTSVGVVAHLPAEDVSLAPQGIAGRHPAVLLVEGMGDAERWLFQSVDRENPAWACGLVPFIAAPGQ